ncbi:uncharacterized protein LOC144076308 [Stigmatopora argus]
MVLHSTRHSLCSVVTGLSCSILYPLPSLNIPKESAEIRRRRLAEKWPRSDLKDSMTFAQDAGQMYEWPVTEDSEVLSVSASPFPYAPKGTLDDNESGNAVGGEMMLLNPKSNWQQ